MCWSLTFYYYILKTRKLAVISYLKVIKIYVKCGLKSRDLDSSRFTFLHEHCELILILTTLLIKYNNKMLMTNTINTLFHFNVQSLK